MSRDEKAAIIFGATVLSLIWNVAACLHYLINHWYGFPLMMSMNAVIVGIGVLAFFRWACK